MTVTALASRTIVIPREIMCFNRNISRLYHRHRKLGYTNNFLLGKCLSPALFVDTWSIQRTCHSSKSNVEKFPSTLSKQQSKEIVSKLTTEECDLFLTALKERKSEEDRTEYQSELASSRWCNVLGRSNKIPSLGEVDATGKYCRVPEDWLMRKYVENVPGPSNKTLILVAIQNAIPYIGFGFFDNFIMIIAGEQIDVMFNTRFPILTITAAALGNTVSDIVAITTAQYIELFAQKIGFPALKLTSLQLNLRKTKRAANVGRIIGITIGCLIGMSPIPFLSWIDGKGFRF